MKQPQRVVTFDQQRLWNESFSDLFARRRQLMDEWAAYLNGQHGTGNSPPR